jgi:hypothetical protein
MKNITLSLILLIGFGVLSSAQETSTTPKSNLESGNIESQFNYVINKSETYETYKVIRRTWLDKLRKNTLDSISALDKKIDDLQISNEEQQNQINALKAELKENNTKLDKAIREKESFSFLGSQMAKGSYNLMVWSIIFILLGGVLIALFLFKRSNDITQKTKEALEDKQEEFDAHRKWALEREQTLARDLNKLKQRYKGLE